jgi:cytochrome c-type biogenesis protein CcmH/NrfF
MPSRASEKLLVRGLLASLCLSLLMQGSAWAEGFAYDLAAELMSPYCPGRTLASCPSPQATELIQWISMQEAGGATEDEVVEMLIEQFGEEILGAPPAEGITLWAYVFPVVGFLGGGGVVALVLRRLVGGKPADETRRDRPVEVEPESGGPPVPPLADEELARLVDAELAERN